MTLALTNQLWQARGGAILPKDFLPKTSGRGHRWSRQVRPFYIPRDRNVTIAWQLRATLIEIPASNTGSSKWSLNSLTRNVTRFWPRYGDGKAFPRQGKQTQSPQTEGNISRWTTQRLNGYASVWLELKRNATRRHRLLNQTMALTKGKRLKLW